MREGEDTIHARMQDIRSRANQLQKKGHYFYNQPVEEMLGGTRVYVGGHEMLMFSSYSYLGLNDHPRIKAAAKAAIDKFGTGTHGVRTLSGSLNLHVELESTIADFKHAEASITFSSGYVANLTAISTLVDRHDVVICDKLNHASIVDGCMFSGANLMRFRHNDMDGLERCLKAAGAMTTKFVVVDAVFSMDGDIINLPKTIELCRQYDAWLMVDESHSVGVLGKTGGALMSTLG